MSKTIPGIIFAILGGVGVLFALLYGFWLLLFASLLVLTISVLNALSAAKIEREDAIRKTAKTPVPARTESIADTIARLEEMRVAGVLSGAEFEEAKRKALGG